jgi:hypothetical protein
MKRNCFQTQLRFTPYGRDHKIVNSVEQVLRGFKNRLIIGEREFFFDRISGLSINQRNTLIIHYDNNEEFYNIKGPDPFSALKYLYLYNLAG